MYSLTKPLKPGYFSYDAKVVAKCAKSIFPVFSVCALKICLCASLCKLFSLILTGLPK